ncbi:MASE1 domain-containing protein [Dyella nitratireducens]|uniref:MASE1 domain-containing protein n=1 Tax=Dyella nitratireducens TaxID=1849580 RepID=UPI00166737B3|nr:MASE1 domain-containing protein [Dyella nitratireducens]
MQIAVAIGYALAYLAVRPFSDAQWTLTSGLRVTCLLLMPYRFWPALVVGEVFPLTWWNYEAGFGYGWTWVLVASIPPIAIGMPIAWWCRKCLALFPSPRSINISALLQCLLWLSTIWALITQLLYLTAKLPASEEIVGSAVGAVAYFLGSYLGMITILPWALLARLEQWQGKWCFKLQQLFASRVTHDMLHIVLPLMGALFVLGHVDQGEIGNVARAAMILPVAWLTLRHGWRASLVGSAFVATCVSLRSAQKIDVSMVQEQLYLVIGVACLYALGACISAQKQQKDQVRKRMLQTQRAAKNSLNFDERRLEQASRALESVLGVLEIEQLTVSEKLRHIATDTERRVYDKQASMLQQRIYHLAESIHPSAWRQGGMQAALGDSIGRVLHEVGLSYRFSPKGRCSQDLSPSIQAAIYRCVCSAVASMSSDLTCAAIDVVMRTGTTYGHRWVMLRINGSLSELSIARNICLAAERGRVAPKLGTHALDFQDLRNLIRLFDGDLRIREGKDMVQVTALLFDGFQEAKEGELTFASPRLWVS